MFSVNILALCKMKDERENGSEEQFVKPGNTKNCLIPLLSNTARNKSLTSVLFTLFGQSHITILLRLLFLHGVLLCLVIKP